MFESNAGLVSTRTILSSLYVIFFYSHYITRISIVLMVKFQVDVHIVFNNLPFIFTNTGESICQEEFLTLQMEALILTLSQTKKHISFMGI